MWRFIKKICTQQLQRLPVIKKCVSNFKIAAHIAAKNNLGYPPAEVGHNFAALIETAPLLDLRYVCKH